MKILLTLLTSLPAFIAYAQIEVTGTVKNFSDSIFYLTETGGFHNFTRVWRDNKIKVRVNSDKTFNVTIPEESVGAWYLKTANGTQIFHLVQGENQELVVDFSRPHSMTAIGKHAANFNFSALLHDSITKYYSEKKFLEKIRTKNIDSALSYRKEFASYKIRLLNNYRSTHVMSDYYYNWLHTQYVYEPFERTLVENINNRDSLDDETIAIIMEKGMNDEYAALNTNEYNDLVSFYVVSKFNRSSTNRTLAHRFNFVAEGNILSGSTKDVYLSRFMAGLIKTPDSIYHPLYKKYDQIVQNKKMKQLVSSRRKDYQNPTNTPVSVSDIKNTSLTDIFKKYKGKVIYIDFWASWCIPCRAEMPNAALLKEKLKGQNIVFLYFGYNDKETAWLKARNQLEIQGEHYLLNDTMIKEADEIFGINGIPHYAIIDKNGNIVSRRADRPSDSYNELFKLTHL
jgi:thiol-disulfide isomerase/thioredoxin